MKDTKPEYKVGDLAWFVPNGHKKAVKGEIVSINMEVETPYACLLEQVDSKYRTTMVSLLADSSTEAKKLYSSHSQSK
tara:strand:- start:206 stop:439 length:234 start_codon:yes stop_codon:yes gene_type:complete